MTSECTTQLPQMSVLLPQGWIALHIDDRATDEVRRIVTQVMESVAPDKRDLARPRLRAMLQNLVEQSRERGVWEVWLPIGATAGIHIPASVAVAPLPRQPSAGMPVQDVLLSMSAATPGARAVTVGGALAVRTVADRPVQRDAAGEVTAPAARIVNYIVSPAAKCRQWMTFTASLFVPDTEDSAQIVEALEFLFDALMASVTFPPEEAAE